MRYSEPKDALESLIRRWKLMGSFPFFLTIMLVGVIVVWSRRLEEVSWYEALGRTYPLILGFNLFLGLLLYLIELSKAYSSTGYGDRSKLHAWLIAFTIPALMFVSFLGVVACLYRIKFVELSVGSAPSIFSRDAFNIFLVVALGLALIVSFLEVAHRRRFF